MKALRFGFQNHALRPLVAVFLALIVAHMTRAANGVAWSCVALDKGQQAWQASGAYEVQVITMAVAACKKNSAYPKSCFVKADSCERFVNGRPTKPLWECQALDVFANAWTNRPSLAREDAAIAAKERCLHNSPGPDTCYTNMVSCVNLRAD